MKSLRKSTGGLSETGSEQSHDRDSTGSDLKPLPPLPNTQPPAPERGILKNPHKRGRSMENLGKQRSWRHSNRDHSNAECGELEPLAMRNTFEPPRNPYLMHGYFGSKGKRLSASSGALPIQDSVEYRLQLQRQVFRLIMSIVYVLNEVNLILFSIDSFP